MSHLGLTVALVGNPNCGKTALFNRLTGARQKVANYAGVTVERKEGRLLTPKGQDIRVLDLPGTYSLDALTPDEVVTKDVIMGGYQGEAAPDLIVCVMDATNLRLHLRFALELKALGRPMICALNMMDEAKARGIKVETKQLSEDLGVEIIETVALDHKGVENLVARLDEAIPRPSRADKTDEPHARVRQLLADYVKVPPQAVSRDEALDRILLHPVAGLLILMAIMFVVFQSVFAWAAPLQDGIEWALGAMGAAATNGMPDGLLKAFVNEALFGGLGAVLVFLPQILILFLFILVLEQSGYLPRAAFLLDGPMAKAGLTGRSFIPLLSSFACAIPGIMATRSIPDPRDRLLTILIAPLMTCSARLPVYTLLIGAFIPEQTVGVIFNLRGLVLFGLFLGGIISAFLVSWIVHHLRKNRYEQSLMMELPSYRWPNIRDIGLGLWERAVIFVSRITGVIFAANTLLWLLATFPRPPKDATGPAIDYSFAGQIGHFIEPIFAPLGFNWQICVALVPGMAAREVAVSALGTVYAISGSEDEVAAGLSTALAQQWTLATALSLLVWYIFAPQCISTLAVIRRETNSWRNVAIAAGYLFGLAYVASLLTYQIAKAFL